MHDDQTAVRVVQWWRWPEVWRRIFALAPRLSHGSMSPMTPFENALVAHLVSDWLLQNDWMARHKSSLLHPAAWVHSGIHGVWLGFILGWPAGLVLGIAHMIVDTRVPQRWWAQLFRQTNTPPLDCHVRIWGDQVIHIGMIALWLHVAPLAGA